MIPAQQFTTRLWMRFAVSRWWRAGLVHEKCLPWLRIGSDRTSTPTYAVFSRRFPLGSWNETFVGTSWLSWAHGTYRTGNGSSSVTPSTTLDSTTSGSSACATFHLATPILREQIGEQRCRSAQVALAQHTVQRTVFSSTSFRTLLLLLLATGHTHGEYWQRCAQA